MGNEMNRRCAPVRLQFLHNLANYEAAIILTEVRRLDAVTQRAAVGRATGTYLNCDYTALRARNDPGVDGGGADRRVVRINVAAPDRLRRTCCWATKLVGLSGLTLEASS